MSREEKIIHFVLKNYGEESYIDYQNEFIPICKKYGVKDDFEINNIANDLESWYNFQIE